MDAAPPSTQGANAPQPSTPAVVEAWPRSAQLTTAFLLGVSATLLAVQVCGTLRWGSRPTALTRGGLTYRIDLNTATRAELLQLPGVGENLVQRIDERRQERPFRSVNELTEVPGIGTATLERLRPWVCVRADVEEDDSDAPRAPARAARASPNGPSRSDMEPAGRRAPGKKEANLTKLIDINRANAEELQKLPGIGPKLSQRIIDERQKAPFKSVEELRRVSGIGPKTLDKLRPYITTGKEPVRLATAD